MAERLEPGSLDDDPIPAEEWIAVYTNLVAENHRLLKEVSKQRNQGADREILARHIQVLEEQLAIWRARLPSAGPPTTHLNEGILGIRLASERAPDELPR